VPQEEKKSKEKDQKIFCDFFQKFKINQKIGEKKRKNLVQSL
jgi:hypothetical protein